jgi:thiamine biosynthesis lipoprotein
MATSGDYRRCVHLGTARVAHTMDARRGAPVNNGVASVTVLAGSCMQADAWATALLVAGAEQGLAMAQRLGLDVLYLLRRGEGLLALGLGRFAESSESTKPSSVASHAQFKPPHSTPSATAGCG